jgi:hypothetical protein
MVKRRVGGFLYGGALKEDPVCISCRWESFGGTLNLNENLGTVRVGPSMKKVQGERSLLRDV